MPRQLSNAERIKHLQESHTLLVGDIVRVLTVPDELVKGILCCNQGVYNGEDVIGAVTGFTEKRVVVALLHPISGIVVHRSDKNIERVFETAPTA